MHFGFALELSDIDLWNIDLLDTHLDLLDTDIPSKYFVCLHSVFKTSLRHVFRRYSRHIFKTSSRRLQDQQMVSGNYLSIIFWCFSNIPLMEEIFEILVMSVMKTADVNFLKKFWKNLYDSICICYFLWLQHQK